MTDTEAHVMRMKSEEWSVDSDCNIYFRLRFYFEVMCLFLGTKQLGNDKSSDHKHSRPNITEDITVCWLRNVAIKEPSHLCEKYPIMKISVFKQRDSEKEQIFYSCDELE